MAKGNNQKRKLLYLLKIFWEETDEQNGLSIGGIIQRLDEYGVTADRKTLYTDFEELRQFGLDILAQRAGRDTTYRLVSRPFEVAELKLLVDSVQSSRFITERKSRSLIKKLESLVSVHDARQLQRQVLIAGRIKTMNESIYYNVDKLHAAINRNCRIRFQYFQWNVGKQEELRHGGAWYEVSPWHLRWDDENYYLIGYDAASGKIKHYRVDKMKRLSVTDDPRQGQEAMRDFDPAAYANRLFGMYGGEPVRVTLEGENGIIGVLIDRFGKEIPVVRTDADHFQTFVDVAVSPQFLGWVASLGGQLRVSAPASVVEQMRNLGERLAEFHRPQAVK